MDEIARYNIERWKALDDAEALFTRPELHLDPTLAQALLDPERRLGDVVGKAVLCLACGGGQQSVAFALLGAHVTVVDLSDAQLQRDREAAAHYGLDITVLQGDMRDLSALATASFDIVYHPSRALFVAEPLSTVLEVRYDRSIHCKSVSHTLRPAWPPDRQGNGTWQ
jgi:2-polyprenyl-3-methyl-5-hydroxy-6-metoxy-1,4-benzoquinol methylase